jgi:hypothetical protein
MELLRPRSEQSPSALQKYNRHIDNVIGKLEAAADQICSSAVRMDRLAVATRSGIHGLPDSSQLARPSATAQGLVGRGIAAAELGCHPAAGTKRRAAGNLKPLPTTPNKDCDACAQ